MQQLLLLLVMFKIPVHGRTRNNMKLCCEHSAPIIACCTRQTKRKVLNVKITNTTVQQLVLCSDKMFFLLRGGKKIVHSISLALTVVRLHATSHWLYTNVGKKKTCLLDAKTENRRNELRVSVFTYVLHSGELLLCRSGLCEAKEKPLTIHKMYFFRLYSVVLSTHNANLAKKSL